MTTKKKAAKKKKHPKVDSKLIAAKDPNETGYAAKKNKTTRKKVREAVKEVGHSRKKVNKKLQDEKLK